MQYSSFPFIEIAKRRSRPYAEVLKIRELLNMDEEALKVLQRDVTNSNTIAVSVARAIMAERSRRAYE